MAQFPFTVSERIVDGQYIREYPRATASQDARLRLAVKKYVPVDNPHPQPGDLTIIGAPGGGFPKELYEPLWEDLLAKCKQAGIRIGSIWTADAANLGESGVLNEAQLGNDPSWLDHSRDLLYMTNQFRAEMPRPIIGVGHSMGAGQLVLLSVMHPRLFTSLVLVEPVIVPDTFTGYGPLLSKLSLKRRDVWPSRSIAIQAARKSHKKWDKRVFERWCSYGYRSLPTALYPQPQSSTQSLDDGSVTLASTKHQEVVQYIRPNFEGHKAVGQISPTDPVYEPLFQPDVIGPPSRTTPFYRSEPVLCWKLLDHVRPSVLYVFGGTSPISRAETCAELLQRTGAGIGGSGGAPTGQVLSVRIPGFGHQVPLEEVSKTASAILQWIQPVFRKWLEDEVRIAENWADLPTKDKSTVSAEWTSQLEAACKIYEPKSKL
ncbi:unnamed protein product [Penicillium olsonii]|uniref:AB hydrolase-1 domain-containing protein n=1 Tax=Penicillium olsonii TaxID=99116 RepID=A0A9W4HZV3_PENOL|nr:unnamed protein product [Penicillium olsonii]CAG8201319.1 unnamed protein product [Penicillium olsonii]